LSRFLVEHSNVTLSSSIGSLTPSQTRWAFSLQNRNRSTNECYKLPSVFQDYGTVSKPVHPTRDVNTPFYPASSPIFDGPTRNRKSAAQMPPFIKTSQWVDERGGRHYSTAACIKGNLTAVPMRIASDQDVGVGGRIGIPSQTPNKLQGTTLFTKKETRLYLLKFLQKLTTRRKPYSKHELFHLFQAEVLNGSPFGLLLQRRIYRCTLFTQLGNLTTEDRRTPVYVPWVSPKSRFQSIAIILRKFSPSSASDPFVSRFLPDASKQSLPDCHRYVYAVPHHHSEGTRNGTHSTTSFTSSVSSYSLSSAGYGRQRSGEIGGEGSGDGDPDEFGPGPHKRAKVCEDNLEETCIYHASDRLKFSAEPGKSSPWKFCDPYNKTYKTPSELR
jgi:hypothetical protein